MQSNLAKLFKCAERLEAKYGADYFGDKPVEFETGDLVELTPGGTKAIYLNIAPWVDTSTPMSYVHEVGKKAHSRSFTLWPTADIKLLKKKKDITKDDGEPRKPQLEVVNL